MRTCPLIVAAVVCACVLTVHSQVSQAQEKPLENEVRVFRIRNVDATMIVRPISDVMMSRNDQVMVTVDQASNSLIVRGSKEGIEQLSSLVEVLDVLPERDEPMVKVFQLANMSADSSLEQVLSMITSNNNTRFALDYERNTVVAQGSAAGLAVIEALLLRLDVPRESAKDRAIAAGPWRLRVVWMITGVENGEALPEDLQPVATELERIGVKRPSIVAQMMINVQNGGEFNLSGSAELDTAAQVRVNGRVSNGQIALGGDPNLELEISATRELDPGRNSSRGFNPQYGECQLSTSVSAPVGHHVVLGVTPVGKMTSVFVVQLLAQDK